MYVCLFSMPLVLLVLLLLTSVPFLIRASLCVFFCLLRVCVCVVFVFFFCCFACYFCFGFGFWQGEQYVITADRVPHMLPCGDLCAKTCLAQEETQPVYKVQQQRLQ